MKRERYKRIIALRIIRERHQQVFAICVMLLAALADELTCWYDKFVGGVEKPGNKLIPSDRPVWKYLSRYADASRRSQSSTMCPPYMISPKM